MKNYKNEFFIKTLSVIAMMCVLPLNCNAATNDTGRTRISTRANTTVAARRPTATRQSTTTAQQPVVETETVFYEEPEPLVIDNKTTQFEDVISSMSESPMDEINDSEFAEQIRKQRAALFASESADRASVSMQNSLANGVNACDTGLRQCMKKTCGDDFTKCALDGDTLFGDKLNRCRRGIECTGEEFRLFTTEIKADRDLNVQLQSYTAVIECGNAYNACIQEECGTTFNKCLGKNAQDKAIKACEKIAKNCTEQDSGLSQRVGYTIGVLREHAEIEVKSDEERMYALRDLMRNSCERIGAMFDERSFDCVYTVNFFTGEEQQYPTASRKRYAGDTFICMQEWFGINATTYKENAYRETRSQTGASSAMLGSGLGTATGLITSGAIDRALETQKAKKDLKEECRANKGTFKNGKCELPEEPTTPTPSAGSGGGDQEGGEGGPNDEAPGVDDNNRKNKLKGTVCTDAKAHHLLAVNDGNGGCIVKSCVVGYKLDEANNVCVKKDGSENKPKGTVCTNAKEHHLYAVNDGQGNCVVKSCVVGYKLESNVCVKKEKTTRTSSDSSSKIAPEKKQEITDTINSIGDLQKSLVPANTPVTE